MIIKISYKKMKDEPTSFILESFNILYFLRINIKLDFLWLNILHLMSGIYKFN